MESLERWEIYWAWTRQIRHDLAKIHTPDIHCWKQVPYMKVVSDDMRYAFEITCMGCKTTTDPTPIAKKHLIQARWFILPAIWCREWNFFLKALIDLEKNIKTTELEIMVRGLDEVVYQQLKPDYDTRMGVHVLEKSDKEDPSKS